MGSSCLAKLLVYGLNLKYFLSETACINCTEFSISNLFQRTCLSFFLEKNEECLMRYEMIWRRSERKFEFLLPLSISSPFLFKLQNFNMQISSSRSEILESATKKYSHGVLPSRIFSAAPIDCKHTDWRFCWWAHLLHILQEVLH